jgi:hypothetical protein
MLPAHRFLDEIIASLRTVIAPAIADPYAKAQAYMAAVILEFVARQVEERSDLERAKARALDQLFADLPGLVGGSTLPPEDDAGAEARLCRVIDWLYAERARLGPDIFTAANMRVRRTLRELLDEDLKVAGKVAG